MNYSRTRTRKFLYQMLYASTFSEVDTEVFRDTFFSWVFNWELDEEYLDTMFSLITKNQSFLIEKIIKNYTPRFNIKDMDLSYIIPIFISVTELIIYQEEIPKKVSLNEAIQISKVYWSDSSRKTVNWVLNKILNDLDLLRKSFLDYDKSDKTIIFKN